MNLILGIVVLIAWVVYRTTRPSQFRVIELDGEYYLEIKGWLTGIWWDAYAWASGDITYDSDLARPYNSLEKVQRDLDAYAKYISKDKRKKVIKVVYRVEG